MKQQRVIRLFISTGEVSGDLQGALLIDALKRQAALMELELEILALGGDRMARAGAVLLGNTSEIGSIGLLESLRFVLPTLQVQQQAKHYLKRHPPDMAILIDYMSPNIAWCGYFSKFLPTIPVIYYIAPQEWVWSLNSYNTDRVVKTTKVLAIFPEEAHYFRQKGGQVSWVGHPLVDRMQTALKRENARATLSIAPDQRLITLLPASRQQEINYLLPVICQAAQQIQAKLPDVRFLIPLALEKYRRPIEQAIQRYGLQATIISDRATPTDAPETSVTLQAIAAADLAITKSGTVNLEIALLNVPQVVLYKVNSITAWVLKHLLKFSIPFMSPPNLVMMEAIVPEFMQDEATPDNLAQEALDILLNPERRQIMMADYQKLQQALGEPGVCDRAAKEILQLLPLEQE